MKLISFKYQDTDRNIKQLFFRDTEKHHVGFKIINLKEIKKGNIGENNNVMIFISLNDYNYYLSEMINELQSQKFANEYYNFLKSNSVLFVVNDIIEEIKKL